MTSDNDWLDFLAERARQTREDYKRARQAHIENDWLDFLAERARQTREDYNHALQAQGAYERALAESRAWINPDSTEGAAIITLFKQLKEVEHSDGSRSGSEVVGILDDWLTRIGLHPAADIDQAVEILRSRPHPWTVFGLRNNDRDGDTLIASVVAGYVNCRDTDDEEGGRQRVAESVVAANPADAESMAYDKFEAARDD